MISNFFFEHYLLTYIILLTWQTVLSIVQYYPVSGRICYLVSSIIQNLVSSGI